MQFLPALVEAVDWKEERLRVGDVNGHRHLQSSYRVPHRIEARIVDADQLIGSLLAQVEPERLEDLQALRAGLVGVFDQAGLKLRIAGFGSPGPRRLSEDHESPGMRFRELGDSFPHAAAIAPRETHHRPDVLAIHHSQAVRGLQAELNLVGIAA